MVAVRLVPPPAPDSHEPESHQRLRSIALQLAEAKTFEAVTVDDISARVGISRRTFFRYFPAKEDVLFSDHAGYLAVIEHLLRFSTEPPLAAVVRALGVVMNGYLLDANFAFRRDHLIGETPVLSDREALWFVEYQKVISAHLATDATTPGEAARAAIGAASMVAALRHTFVEWFADPEHVQPLARLAELTAGVAEATRQTTPSGGRRRDLAAGREVIVVNTTLSTERIAELIEGAGP